MKIILGNVQSRVVVSGLDTRKADIMKLLREYTKYHPEGYSRTEAFRKRRWDGWSYLITETGKFASGYLPQVLKFVSEYGIDIEIVDERKNLPRFKKGPIDIKLPDYDLVEHQIKLIQALIYNRIPIIASKIRYPRGIWDAATNSGKTAAFAGVLKHVENPSAMLLISDAMLLQQHYKFFCRIFGSDNVGTVTSGKYKPGTILTIAMADSLYGLMKKDMRIMRDMKTRYNIVGVDESHDFTGDKKEYVITNIEAGCRIFMSGTPLKSSNKDNNIKAIGLSGNVLYKVSKRYLMDIGFSMRPIIRIYNVKQKVNSNYAYEKEYGLMLSRERATLISDLINERDYKRIIITFDIEAHGYYLFQTLLTRYPQYLECADWVHGKDAQRKLKVGKYVKGETRILFCSTILQQGINIEDIETVIYAIGGKAAIPISQFMGRGERLDGINNTFEFIDFFDTGKYLSKHSRLRFKFYNSEELDIEYMYDADKRGTPKAKKIKASA